MRHQWTMYMSRASDSASASSKRSSNASDNRKISSLVSVGVICDAKLSAHEVRSCSASRNVTPCLWLDEGSMRRHPKPSAWTGKRWLSKKILGKERLLTMVRVCSGTRRTFGTALSGADHFQPKLVNSDTFFSVLVPQAPICILLLHRKWSKGPSRSFQVGIQHNTLVCYNTASTNKSQRQDSHCLTRYIMQPLPATGLEPINYQCSQILYWNQCLLHCYADVSFLMLWWWVAWACEIPRQYACVLAGLSVPRPEKRQNSTSLQQQHL